MAARKPLALLVALAALAAAPGASAKVYIDIRPRFSMMAGLDDNVRMDGSGTDSFGQAVPGLKLDIFGEHHLHLDLDCQAGIARLVHPDRFGLSNSAFASNESCALGVRDQLSPRTTLRLLARAMYAQDPFAIAGLGLLLRPGQSQIFIGRFNSEVDRYLTRESRLGLAFDSTVLDFGAGDPGNGYLLVPQVKYYLRTSARSTWELAAREQLFFGMQSPPSPSSHTGTPGGLLSAGHAALLGYTYRLTPWANLIVRGGPLFLTSAQGDWLHPTARFEIESVTPSTAIHLTLAHDLVIGAGLAGPLVGDLAELGVMYEIGRWEGHGRVGMYRNAWVHDAFSAGSMGYGGEIGVDWLLTREFKLGVAAMRDARLSDATVGRQVDRDVVQFRLTWERARLLLQ